MPIELHVWGPAFGLPSIDPQCLASIAMLKLSFPEGAWVLVADHDPSINPNNIFPALLDGSRWITGFQAIAGYIQKNRSLDGDLTELQHADGRAYSSLIECSAQPLLDLSLYVSYENCRQTTRPAWSAILPWHANYALPQNIRASVKARTAHLGLSALDIDKDDSQASTNERADSALPSEESVKPRSLLLPRKETIRSMLSGHQYTGRFKLDALMSAFFDPLSSLLSSKEYLLSSSHPTTLDCLATGYLALALSPRPPQPWLRNTLNTKYPSLRAYTTRMLHLVFDSVPINSADIRSLNALRDPEVVSRFRTEKGYSLPWSPSSSTISSSSSSSSSVLSALYTTHTLLLAALTSPFPTSTLLRPDPLILPPTHSTPSPSPQSWLFSRHLRQWMMLATGLAGWVGWVAMGQWGVQNGEKQVFGGVEAKSDAGRGGGGEDEAGAMLAALGREIRVQREAQVGGVGIGVGRMEEVVEL
ncbi:MAG: hypothetical protein M1821_004904 [Bathelium mastoideum]|nr:MAG: hypothetical protein M1821_004904 [Bathelium mastoideum]